MRLIYFPTKDATIYTKYPDRNTGLDEIISCGKDINGTDYFRSLIMFDLNMISSSVADGTLPLNTTFEMKLYVAKADNLSPETQIELDNITAYWKEGVGYFYQTVDVASPFIEPDGVTWNQRMAEFPWNGGAIGATISYTNIPDPVADMTFDVTNVIHSFISGTDAVAGFIVRYTGEDEATPTEVGSIDFFSRQTHTIYAPTLSAKWIDQIYTTGSLSGSTEDDRIIVTRNLSPEYRIGDTVKVNLSIRERYPLKSFDTLFSRWNGDYTLPATSYFSIVDIQSNTTIIPFDDFSRISCDGTNSYCKFSTTGLYAGRYYKILVKVVDTNSTRIVDLGHHFIMSQT